MTIAESMPSRPAFAERAGAPPGEHNPWGGRHRVYRRRAGFTVEALDAHGEDGKLVVRFQNGKRLQITPKLHRLLAEVDGESTCEEIARRLQASWGAAVTAADVEGVAERFLRPYQLVAGAGEPDAAAEPPKRSWVQRWRDKLLLQDFFFRFTLVPRTVVQAVTRHTQVLFASPVVVAVLASFAVMTWVLYAELAARRAAGTLGLTSPADYLVLVLLLLAGVLLHEVGHASAVARYGAVPDHIGFGLYFIYPAFYANVNESWRFSRRQRVVVDLAGIYFQIVAMLAFFAAYQARPHVVLLYAVVISQALAVYSLVPFFKFDGYWCLSDALGVPNLRKRAFHLLYLRLGGLLRRARQSVPAHLRMAPAIETALLVYAVSSVAFFVFVLWSLSTYAPGLFMEYPDYARRSLTTLASSFSSGLFSQAGVVLIRLLLRTFVLVGISLVLLSLGINVHSATKNLAQRRS
jgi:putative peptide zinc metalloprotease protein